MKTCSAFLLIIALTACLLPARPLYAQPIVDTIRANPAAVQLRRVWTITGQPGDQIGGDIGTVGDINGDGINDIACYCYCNGNYQTRIYSGDAIALKTLPSNIVKGFGLASAHPVNGRFYGGSRQVLVLQNAIWDTITFNGNQTTAPFRRYYFFHVDSGRIDTLPFLELDTRRMIPRTRIAASEVLAADLDGDGSDELILYTSGAIRGTVLSRVPEVWIYRGGPGFQVDSPTVILHDTEENGGGGFQKLIIGNWNHDNKPDIATSSDYSNGNIQKLKLWFSSPASPWSWTTPEREYRFGGFSTLDCDGDGLLDVAFPLDGSRTAVLLSSGTKGLQDQPLMAANVDRVYYRDGYKSAVSLGFISDSLRRYEMLGVFPGFGLPALGLSGGPGGPDRSYETYDRDIGVSLRYIGDVTGDGWDDLMDGYPDYAGDAGIARIYAGGPYIPRDSSSGVREIPVTGEDKPKLFCWPVPMHNELNIAWHGTMKRFPARFDVHDALGRLVATGSVEPYKGAALWQAGPGITPGTYILRVYDRNGALLGTQKIVKSEL